MENIQQENTQQVNVDDLNPLQALSVIVNAIRQLSFTYDEHVRLDQHRINIERELS